MPEVPDRPPSALRAVWQARRDLLPLFPRAAYRHEVMTFRALRRRLLVVNEPETVREVFVLRHDVYGRKSRFMERALAPVIGDSLFINHGPAWAARRAAIAPLFHPSRLGDFHGLFVQAAAELADSLARTGGAVPVDMAAALARATARVVMLAVFGPGVPEEATAELAAAFTDYQDAVESLDLAYLAGLPGWLSGGQGRRARGAATRIRALIERLVAAARPGDGGLLATIRESLAGAKASDTAGAAAPYTASAKAPYTAGAAALGAAGEAAVLVNEIGMLLLAGSETAANALGWTLLLLARDPAALRGCREEMAAVLGEGAPGAEALTALVLTRAAMQEAMRLYPPVAILSRQAARADRIRRWEIAPGDTVMAIPWLLHRHEALWERPHHFLPERFLPEAAKRHRRFAYIPFGLGPRVCAGAAFGMAEMTVLLAVLLRRFDFAVAPGHVPMPRLRLTLRPAGGLPMLATPR
ncbi:cytochrome P450 [Roseomonas sp. NAR14]|uniref:Cytochrome P450 n=1 Tax=Roseomonas acroporae TaxID=2937791 RepID=A0A9X1Y885_9PROT|nr:cytochrome P450 [Roseomonas acroporae]MCK8785301.1 cytochrome P450 [Roseomonas acroporae]